jgi:hypothetical protein
MREHKGDGDNKKKKKRKSSSNTTGRKLIAIMTILGATW